MSPVLACLAGLFAVTYGPVAIFAMRHRELGRLAVREAVRRKGQALLVVAGLMVGTAAITAALVAADSAEESSVAIAVRNWGSVDLTVTGGNQFFAEDVANRLAADPAVARVTDGVSAGIDLAGSASDLATRRGASKITLVGFDPRAQKPFGAYVLTTGRRTLGQNLSPDGALLSRVLADKLGAKVGDRVHVGVGIDGYSGGPAADVRVAGIARPEGPGGYTLGSAVFAPLETAQRIAGTGLINIIRISAPGGIRDSVAAGDRAAPVIERAVAALGSRVPLEVREAKARDIDISKVNSQFNRALLVGMSALVVAAGAALVVSLTVMLAEERRPRLGVLRALGLTRSRLMGLSVTEGALYSLAAGVLGTVAGAAAGRLVSERVGDVFAAYAGPDSDFPFLYSLKPATLVAGFTVGTVLTLAVIFFASRRTSRMTIVAAIRDLPEPPAVTNRHPRMRAVWLAICAAAGGAALTQSHFPRLAGGIVLILVLSSLARPRLSWRSHATLAGLALAGWPLAVIDASDAGADPGTFILVLVVGMLTAVFGLTIGVSANLHIAEMTAGLLGRASAGLRAVLRPPLAYLSRRPLRTGLTTGVFAVIVSMLTLFSVLFVINRPDYQRFGSGYDVQIQSTGSAAVHLPAAVRAQVMRSVTFPTRGYIGRVTGDGPYSTTEREFVPLLQVGQDFADGPPLRLGQRDHRFHTDHAVWEALMRDPSLVVTNIGAPGQKITLQGHDGPVTFTIAGSQPSGFLDGVFGTEQSLGAFRDAPQGVTMLLDIRDGAQADVVAQTIKRGVFTQGVDAESVRLLADQAERPNRAWLSVIGMLIRMGLVVAILGLGIVALRIVTERRHVIGILRAIGYKRRSVILALLTESAVTATIGTAVGIVAGITMGYLFYRQNNSRSGFGIDLASTGSLLGLIYLAVVLVTFGPAWRASRLPPAEAVRRTE